MKNGKLSQIQADFRAQEILFERKIPEKKQKNSKTQNVRLSLARFVVTKKIWKAHVENFAKIENLANLGIEKRWQRLFSSKMFDANA